MREVRQKRHEQEDEKRSSQKKVVKMWIERVRGVLGENMEKKIGGRADQMTEVAIT